MMDTIVINITEIPEQITVNVTETAPDVIAINITNGGGGGGVGISAGSNSLGSGVVYFSNANGISFGMNTTGVIIASHNALTVQTGNFLSTNVESKYVLNSLFAGTNISGTVNETAFALSVVASGNSTSFGYQSATPTQTSGYSSILGNNGAWNAINSIASTNATYWGVQSATPSQTTGATSVLANNGAWVTVRTTLGNYISTGDVTGYGTNVPLQTVTANASNSYLAADGAWRTAGTINSTISGVMGHGLSASATNLATMGTIYYSGGNLIIGLTTNANSSHTMSFAVSSINTGFVLNGNTSGSSSFGNTANEKISFAGGIGIYVSGTSNNALTYGLMAVSNFEYPKAWQNLATTYSTAISTASMFVRPFRVDYPVQFSIVDYPMSFNLATTNSSCSFSLAHTVVIYSLNAGGTGLAPIVGNTGASGLTFTSGNNAMSINGPRIISQTMASTILTPGNYWFGVQHNWTVTSGAATASHSWGPMLISMPVSTRFPNWSSSTTATGTINANMPWQGVAPLIATSSNTSGTTNVITIANMIVGSTQGYRANIPIRLKNITY